MCAYACMCYSYVWMRVFMRLSQATNVPSLVSGNEFVTLFYLCVQVTIYIYIYIYNYQVVLAHSTGAVEYADSTIVDG